MALLARRNLFHDRIRFAVTLTGIVFALVLIIVQFGLFLGFTTTTPNNIDHSHADLWVVFHSVGYFDTGRMFSERKYYEALSTPGVQRAEKYIQNFAYWKKPDGGVENVQVIGVHPGGMGEPWNVVEGDSLDVKLVPGRVEAISEEIRLSSELSGRLHSVPVEGGDRVHKGQVLAQIEADARVEDRKRAEAAVASAEARLAEARVGLRVDAFVEVRRSR